MNKKDVLNQVRIVINFIRELIGPMHGYPVGRNVIVRTRTMIYTGILASVTKTDLILTYCSWIPETSRYSEFVTTGEVVECEPYPEDLPVYVSRLSALDMCELRAELPRKLK